MKIKVDVDEVLRSILPVLCEINNEITGESKTIDDFTVYNVDEVFPNIEKITGKPAHHVFFIDNIKRVFENAKPLRGAKEALELLHTHGHYISIVTHQPTLNAKIATLKWLEKNHMYYDEIHFTYNKENVAADIMIDDNPAFFIKDKSSIEKYCVSLPYNNDYVGATHVKSIYEFAQKIIGINS